VRTTGGPFTLYHKFDEENDAVMFSVCYPVAEKMITTAGSGVLTGFLKHGTYYKTTLKGSYEYSDKAWKAATEGSEYLTGYKVVENGEPFEIYGNNPHETPNPADLITEIYIPVEKAEVVDQLPEPVPADSISE
jgi:predicted transcriptional regulator YdeE